MRELTVWLLCGIGVYASAYMAGKVRRDERGEVTEPSVVQQPAARLFFGIPNAYFGLAFYPLVAVTFSFAHECGWVRIALTAFTAIGAIVSCVLGYDLLAVTKRPCPYCWTVHFINAVLLFQAAGLWRT